MTRKISTSILFALSISFGLTAQISSDTDTLQFTKPEKLGENVNSKAEESLPLLSADGKTIYFARTFDAGNLGGKNGGQDIWSSSGAGAEWSRANHSAVPLNSKGNDAVLGICRDGKRLYLLNQQKDKKGEMPGISISDWNEASAKWSAPVAVLIPESEIFGHFYSAYVSPAEDFMLWTIPLQGDTIGNDLFVSTSADRGASWSAPKSLGATINSPNDEISPFYDSTRGLLFFARNNASDLFDYTIYYTKKLDETWKSWTSPKELSGVNSTGFDAYFMITPSGEAYFTSNRNDSLADIYYCKIAEIELESQEVDSLPLVETTPIDISEPVLIIETKDGTKTDRDLRTMTKEELTAESTNIRFVYFDFDKYAISKKYLDVLDDAAELLDKYPELNLRIEGHTDAVGSESYNQVLSEQRAASVKEFMVIQGMDPARVQTLGFGKSRPLGTNYTDEGRAKNRRVELFFKEPK